MSAALGPVGFILGGGLLARRTVEAAVDAGRAVRVVVLEGFADPADYAPFPHIVCRLGAAGRMLAWLRAEGARQLVLVGRVTRPSLLSLRPDAGAAKLLPRIGMKAFGGDDSLLTAMLRVLREEGFEPLGCEQFLTTLQVPTGQLAGPPPDEAARRDIRRGVRVLDVMGPADVGQGCVVQEGVVLAVEAVEGTDAMIARAGTLQREAPGGVLVKLLKPGQDRRTDLPVIGPSTIRGAIAAGLRGVAIEADGCIVVESEETRRLADEAGLFLIAIRPAEWMGDV
ncbi:LpxI family protein [Humitalea sp. 24SJ18S-53]|uniref:LpxI family protein n=1 Tax=Humitalea sp. 24SJ18S-53 TaxID=3422307 RepID=UPI003D668846